MAYCFLAVDVFLWQLDASFGVDSLYIMRLHFPSLHWIFFFLSLFMLHGYIIPGHALTTIHEAKGQQKGVLVMVLKLIGCTVAVILSFFIYI